MTWLSEIWSRSGKQFRRLGGFLLAALVIGFGVEWLATSNARMIVVQPATINDLALSPDGKTIAIAYANGIGELRETGHSRRLIRRFGSQNAPVMDVHLDDATEVGLRLTMARADGRILIETAMDGQRLSDDITFTQSLLTPQIKVAEDGAIWAHGINEQGAWIGRLEPGGNYAQPVGMGETGSAKMTLLSATSERAHLISDRVHTIWARPIEQTNAPTEPKLEITPEIESRLSRMSGTPGIIERVPLGDGYVTLQNGHVMTATNGIWRTATEFFDESLSSNNVDDLVGDEIGGVTIYGGGAQGDGTTASGEILNSSALTAAHRTLPFGTEVEVTNLANDQSVVLRVNDRGPFEDGMVIGVTAIGAMQLGLVTSSVESGPPQVRVRVVGTDDETSNQTGRLVEQLETSSRELVAEQSGPITAARYSNNGQLIATSDQGGTATLWDANTLRVIAPLNGHSGAILDINFSPDDSRIVTASEDGTARVWTQAADGTWQDTLLEGHSNEVKSAMFSPDGAKIVTASYDRTARVWSVAGNGSWASKILDGHSSLVVSAAFSPDGNKIVTTSYDRTARVWTEASDDNWESTALEGHSDWVVSATFSPDGMKIVTASTDTTARVWSQTSDGAWVNTTLEGHLDGVETAAFSPDGTQIVTGSMDATARFWTQDNDGNWESVSLEGHFLEIVEAAFSPDGTKIVTAAGDEYPRIWGQDIDGNWQSEILEGHLDYTTSAEFSPNGTRILTSSEDGTARIWTEASDGTWPPARVGDNCRSDDGVGHLERSALGDPRSLWMWSKDTWLCQLSFEENQLSWIYALPGGTTAVKMLAPWENGPVDSILIGRANGTVEHREVQTDRVHAVYRGHGGPITQIETVSMGGTLRAAIAAADGSVQIVDLPNNAPTLFAKTNTDLNGFVAGLNKLRRGILQAVTLTSETEEAAAISPEPTETTLAPIPESEDETAPRTLAGLFDDVAAALEEEIPADDVAASSSNGSFLYYGPGELIEGTGSGYTETTVFAPDLVFPIKDAPASVQSVVYRPGGAGVGGDQCDSTNYHPIWRDNFCENRSRDIPNPFCEADAVSQVVSIRVGTAEDCNTMRAQSQVERGLHEVVAVADGIITNIGTYTVNLRGDDGTIYYYRHLNMNRLGVSEGDSVLAGDMIGYVSNDFGSTPTVFHLSFEMRQNVDGRGVVSVPPYMSLVRAYERREGVRGSQVRDAEPSDSDEPLSPGTETVTRVIAEREVWGVFSSLDTVSGYESYLERYPDGEFRDQALARIAAINANNVAEEASSTAEE